MKKLYICGELNFALGRWVIRSAPGVFDSLLVKILTQVVSQIIGVVVVEKPGTMFDLSAPDAGFVDGQVQGVFDVFGRTWFRSVSRGVRLNIFNLLVVRCDKFRRIVALGRKPCQDSLIDSFIEGRRPAQDP